ncbi:BAF_collapsed_G0013640.mRNA.1.CDS.1 [Saccharomyces cerevisiae]|nr:BAF_HP2_G0013180.mRNA.1.CDS.1 [Saccharomyces cerevisiae]CAI6449621.1 BAF_HP1_G0013610.mRNA.1.CDS.1 [Saccharomyces cerevisiae]CAI6452621.1 BAF_HP2_G0013180.mRNA.1.CDS.1 [Saccharomyces cerevisiae]CAI7087411.1 BAF_collapsed_G0013640.mRNA.1.CDS.1 [Saccharomyces cerevisiae]
MSSQNLNDNPKNTSSAAEDKKKQTSSLKLAPIPTTSPWKSSSPDSNTVIPVEELRDISKTAKPSKNGSGSIKLTSNTKWTPITPSVIISGPKDTNSKSGKNSKNSKTNKKMKKRGKYISDINKKNFNGQTNSTSEISNVSNLESKPLDANAKVNIHPSSGATASGNIKRITNNNNSTNGRQSRNYQNRNGKTRYNNNSRHSQAANNAISFPNNYQARPEYIPNASHWLNNNSRNSYNQLSYFRQQQYYDNINYQQQLQTPYYYSMEPIFKSIEGIKNQIEFYFSEKNLKTDEFLRSKFKKANDGFIPMSLIGKFYRMINLSLGGDPNLILASMRKILQHKETNHLEIAFGSIEGAQKNMAGDFNPLENYFIRRENWAEYVTESNFDENNDETEKYNIEKLLGPDDLDNYSYMGYPNFFPSNENRKKSQSYDQGEISRQFEQNLQVND